MTDEHDVVAEVKAALAKHDAGRCSCEQGGYRCDVLDARGWLRALLTRCEQAEDARDRHYLITCPWCHEDQTRQSRTGQIMHLIECGDKTRAEFFPLKAEVERLKAELADMRTKWNALKLSTLDEIRAEREAHAKTKAELGRVSDELMACIAPAEVGGGIINHVIERERVRADRAESAMKDMKAAREQDIEAAYRSGWHDGENIHAPNHDVNSDFARFRASRKGGSDDH